VGDCAELATGSCSDAVNILQLAKMERVAKMDPGEMDDAASMDSTQAATAPDRVLTQEELQLEFVLLQGLTEGSLDEKKLEQTLLHLSEIEAGKSKAALVSSDVHDGNVNVYIDGSTPTPVPREVVDTFPQEMLYSFPIEASDVNATHVFLSFDKPMRGEFVRETHVIKSYEYGKVEQRWLVNPMSLFPKAVVGGGGKTQTLSHDGAWPTTGLDRVRAEQASRWSSTNWMAKKMRRAKILATFLFLLQGRLGSQWVDAGTDPNHLAKLAEFVQQNDRHPEASLVQRKNALLQKLAQKSGTSVGAAPSSNANECLHLASHPSLQIISTGVFVPLERKLESYKATVVYSPLQHFDAVVGVSSFTYDSSTGLLNIHMASSSFFHVTDPQGSVQSRLVVGPADGESFAVAEEGRVQNRGPNKLMYGLYHAAHRVPMDYEYLFTDPQELCPPDKYSQLAQEANDMDLSVFMPGREEPSLRAQFDLVNHVVDVLDCGTTFLRGAQQNGNGVGLLELVVWVHFLMESPAEKRLQNVHGWNDM